MPRCVRRNPRYSKHKASGQAVVTIGGHDFYLGPWKSKASFDEYDRVIAGWLAAGRRLPDAAPTGLAIADLVERFWKHVNEYYVSPDGRPTQEVENYGRPLCILNELYGANPAIEFGPRALETCRSAMIAKCWCRRFVNRQTDRIKALFKWSVAQEFIPSSIYEALRCVTGLRAGRSGVGESPPVRPVSDGDVELTLPHLPHVVASMVQIQRLTGARPGEICSMRIGEIEQSGETWTFAPASHKTAHHRYAVRFETAEFANCLG